MANHKTISRRQFLKLSTSVSATIVLSSCLPSIGNGLQSSKIITSNGAYDDYNRWQRKIKAEPVARNFQQLRSAGLSLTEQARMDELYALLVRQSYEYVLEETDANCAYQADEMLSVCLSSVDGYNGGVGHLNLETGETFTSYNQYVTVMNWMAEIENWEYLSPGFPNERAFPVAGVGALSRPLSFAETTNRPQIYKIRNSPITNNPDSEERTIRTILSQDIDDPGRSRGIVQVEITPNPNLDPGQARLINASINVKYGPGF